MREVGPQRPAVCAAGGRSRQLQDHQRHPRPCRGRRLPAAFHAVRAGATVMFSEVTEVRDAIQLLTRRAINEDVGQALIREMAWYDSYLARGGADRSANTTPGNKKGGL